MTGLYTYADALVVCAPRFEDERRTTLLNPKVVVEVLSASSEAYDRGEKFGHYRAIPSVAEYVLVSRARPRIEVYVRDGDAWVMRVSEAGGIAVIPSVAVQLAVDAVYRGVDLDPASRRGECVNPARRGAPGREGDLPADRQQALAMRG